jgi:hypothetical protein
MILTYFRRGNCSTAERKEDCNQQSANTGIMAINLAYLIAFIISMLQVEALSSLASNEEGN